MKESEKLLSNNRAEDTYIVGIGASAGGLSSLQTFFENLDEKLNAAYIVVQHLSPEYKSHMQDILAKHTRMPVLQIESDVCLEAGHVYVIPPKKSLALKRGKLFLMDFFSKEANKTIDTFFASLAKEAKGRAIAVVLSGTGSDGSGAIRMIKEQGGVVIAQKPESAKFDGMPVNAIETGVCDYILEPENIARELTRIIGRTTQHGSLEDAIYSSENAVTLNEIFKVLRKASNIDFTYYKKASIVRRIERRMLVSHMDRLDDYLDLVTQDLEEAKTLSKEILIGVTGFFREPDFYKKLKDEIIPTIVSQASDENPVRIWIVGCSTGEEAYSVAILFAECIEEMSINVPVKIFATDVDSTAVEFAGKGLYGPSITEDISPGRLRKYFYKVDERYHICKEIRKMIVFANHNALQDPPFGRIDFISCRNVMIYFQPILQKRLLDIFHSVLKSDGYLMLGRSENVNEHKDVFEPIAIEEKIYKHSGMIHEENRENSDVGDNVSRYRSMFSYGGYEIEEKNETNHMEAAYSQMINELLGPTIMIDKQNRIVYTSGEAHKYLKVPPGRMELNIGSAVPDELQLALTNAISSVRRDGKTVSYKNVLFHHDNNAFMIDLTAMQIRTEENANSEMIAITAGKTGEGRVSENNEKYEYKSMERQRIRDLEAHLEQIQNELRVTVGKLKSTNDALQTANEELFSSNEELQSSNEELQSMNEELTSVNYEYQDKLQQLTELNNDINNFLNSTMVGIIFVDNLLNIRKFTSYAAREFNLLEHDLNRPIHHISNNFTDAPIVEDCREVLKSLVPVEREVKNNKGKYYIIRITPYRTVDNVIRGLVVSIIDVDEIKLASHQIEKLSAAIEQMPSMITMTDASGRIEYINPSFSHVTGCDKNDTVGMHISSVLSEEEYENAWENLKNKSTYTYEAENTRRNGEKYVEHSTVMPIRDSEGNVMNYLRISEDTSEANDFLTGLPNRKMFQTYVEKQLNPEKLQRFCIAFLDLDEFKVINDTLGHSVGDIILKETAKKLKKVLGKDDYVARFGGDEFLICMKQADNGEYAAQVAEMILEEFEKPILAENIYQKVTISIGIARSEKDGRDYETLIKHADNAMYAAKSQGKNNFKFFSSEITEESQRKANKEKSIETGINKNQFVPYFQPTIELSSGRITSFEALARWKRPGIGLVDPAEFITVAEESTLIHNMTESILKQSCVQAKKWIDLGYEDIKVSVNISQKMLLLGNLTEIVRNALERTGCPSGNVILEMPESIARKNYNEIEVMQSLKKLGVEIALDCFGNGAYTLGQMSKFPVDIVKLDPVFTEQGLNDNQQKSAFEAVIAYVNRMGYVSVAEGVENLRQYQMVMGLGCKEAQGYYLERPMPGNEVLKILAENKGRYSFAN